MNGPYVINPNDFKWIGTCWIPLRVNGNNTSASYDAIYFESYGVEHNPRETKKWVRNKNIVTNF